MLGGPVANRWRRRGVAAAGPGRAVLLLLAVALAAPGEAGGPDGVRRPGAGGEGPLSGDRLPAAADGYLLPPEPVEELLRRDRNYAVLDAVGPAGKRFLVPLRTEISSLERLAGPVLRLAMLELRPGIHRRWRLDTHGVYGLRVYSLPGRRFQAIRTPPGAFISDPVWSPDGTRIAFLAHLPTATQVWVAEVATGASAPLAEAPVNATLATTAPGRAAGPSRMLQWTPEGTVITLLVPRGGAAEASRPRRPAGPLVRRSRQRPTPTRTYPFLLRDEHDEVLFRRHTTSQLAELAPGRPPRLLGEPGMYLSVSLSPDGRYLLTERIVEPLSRITGYGRFPRRLEVRDRQGRVLSVIRELPLQEALPRDDREPGADLPREVAWRPDGRGLSFLWREAGAAAQEGGGRAEGEDRPDRVMFLQPPFQLEAAEAVVLSDDPLSDLRYARDSSYLFVTSSRRDRRTISAYDLRGPQPRKQVLVRDYDPEDVLALPGRVLTRRTANGIEYALLSSEGTAAYLAGPGYREDLRPRPFVDRVSLVDGTKERLFEGSGEFYERPLVPLDPDLRRMIVSRESATDFPDSYLWGPDGSLENLTRNRDPFPEITAARRIDFEFVRRDGLVVHGRLSLPLGYEEGTRVPAVFWTYPREYGSAEEYRRDALRRRNRNAFPHLTNLRWSEIWLTQGYALVAPDVPIVGDPYNDNYIAHIVDTLYAALRRVDEMGYVDVDRVGHGGHSYGAFATANLLAHTPFFKAGIAGSGAYNRSLTPMGFQNERRLLWEAPHVYLEMSPFFHADHINTPLLLYHGADDNNTGTFPIQSERLMHALTGLGKVAVLVVYPYESHSPRAIESYLDLWARWLRWFDTYVKGADG